MGRVTTQMSDTGVHEIQQAREGVGPVFVLAANAKLADRWLDINRIAGHRRRIVDSTAKIWDMPAGAKLFCVAGPITGLVLDVHAEAKRRGVEVVHV